MTGGDEAAGGDGDGDGGGCAPAVPVGWQRKVEAGAVRYVSPSGTSLTSLEQTRAYLLADGTCKCGLECPLNMHKVFNFDPRARVQGRGGPVPGAQDMTKLCNHRRKTVAMATLFRSMENAAPPGLRPPTGLSQGPPERLAKTPEPRTPAPSFLPPTSAPNGALSPPVSRLGPPIPATPPPEGTPPSWGPTASPPPLRPWPPPASPVPPGLALTNQSSNNPPVALGVGASLLPPPVPGVAFPASHLLSAAAKAQLAGQAPPEPPPPSSTLPGVLLSVAGGRGLARPPRRPRRAPTVLRLLQGPDARRPRAREPQPPRAPPPAAAQPLSALLSLLGPPLPSPPPGPDPADSLQPASGSSPQPKPPVPPGATGAGTCPVVPRACMELGGGEEGGLGPAPSLGLEPLTFLGPESGLPLGPALPPCAFLPLAVPLLGALGGPPEPPLPLLGLPGEPEALGGLPPLLLAALLQGQPPGPLLPLGLDLLSPPGGLLSALLPLPDPPGDPPARAPELPDAPLQPLLLPPAPALLALNSALLAAGLGAPDAGPGPPQPSLASPPAAPTSTGATAATTEGPRAEPPPLVSPLLSATLLGDLPALGPGPLLPSQPSLLSPALGGALGLQLLQAQPPLLGQPGAPGPLAYLLQSLQLSSGFAGPEKPLLAPGEVASPPLPQPEPLAPPGLDIALPSALDAPPEPPLEAAYPRSPLKRARRRGGGEGLNGAGPPRGSKGPRRGGGRGRGGRCCFNGQAGEKAALAMAPPHPAWRCNGDLLVPGAPGPLAAEDGKGTPVRLRPSRRGRRRKASAPRPSPRVDTSRARGPSTEPGTVPPVDSSLARRPRPGRPVKNRRRKLLT
ncbi:methyl-CpG-binding domain protein 6 isoform X2 [Alligator mississippiensis]|nr:methyl-CpG-binding domain protein 6 isoform X2 [Alligator mississippiensis]